MTPQLRSAIYTRKSSDEGLDQSFNSLHAQREACAAYVLSQAGEGWLASSVQYDDGGFSGGSMERPGLQALLAAIRRREVDIVVVYKVDRLTRSLADFARIVELFDQHGVSFVSVTQAFNTTTSMGRLTLNVLLSFAQFEREVTGERIRDKIAASKAKGMWMGGRPPFGYDAKDQKLVINEAEAATIRGIFKRYLELGSVIVLQPDLEARGVRSKRWTTRKGIETGGAVLTRGALYHLLSNPVYRGAIRHGDKLYEDAHPAIIDQTLWIAVQDRLAGNCPDHPTTALTPAPAFLAGLVTDDRGTPMRPIHTKRGDRRYRYYVSIANRRRRPPGSLPRIPMGVLDAFVMERLTPALSAGWAPDQSAPDRLRAGLLNVTVGVDRITARLKSAATIGEPDIRGATCARREDGPEIAFAIRLKHRQGALLVSAPGDAPSAPRVDRALVRALCLARSWASTLAAGEVGSTKELARTEGFCDHYAARFPGAGPHPADPRWPSAARGLVGRSNPQLRSVGLGRATACLCPVHLSDAESSYAPSPACAPKFGAGIGSLRKAWSTHMRTSVHPRYGTIATYAAKSQAMCWKGARNAAPAACSAS
jgi:DNA invertase Pin-like site-specific DNA recombinase